jgi:hypothetical protein
MYPIYFTIILLFSFIFSLYIFYIYFYNNLSLFFGKMNHSLYITSTIICIILFLPFVYYINTINLGNKNNNFIFSNLFIMILSFTLWMISIYYKNIIFRNLFIMIIIIVNINLLKNILFDNKKDKIVVDNKKDNIVARYLSIIGLSYLLFHHFFIDFVLWNYYF